MQQTAQRGCCTDVVEITNACSECILQLQTLIEQIWENIASFKYFTVQLMRSII